MRNQYIDTTEDTDSTAYNQSSLAEDENVRRKRNLEMIMLELEIQEKRIKRAINRVLLVLHCPIPSASTCEAGKSSETLYPKAISSRTNP